MNIMKCDDVRCLTLVETVWFCVTQCEAVSHLLGTKCDTMQEALALKLSYWTLDITIPMDYTDYRRNSNLLDFT